MKAKKLVLTNALLQLLILILSTSLLSGQSIKLNKPEIPHIAKVHGTTQLFIDQKPFLILGGELGNSSASSLEYMRPIFPKLESMNLNTVLVPAYWELIEPEENKFDFSLIDSVISSARKYQLKIVFLWFGSWKNSMSCYAPLWVKKDQKRFPRVKNAEGETLEILSPFVKDNMEADAKVFSKLMQHIKNIDSGKKTVIMVQVENEIGMLTSARDHSDLADKFFNNNVPEELVNYLLENKSNLIPDLYKLWELNGFKTKENWEEIFGKSISTDEIFMAWYFGRYTNYVAEKGKKEYSIPMYVNAALIRPGYKPGQYPSAGPLPHLFNIWMAAAPQIDFLSPDIYFKNFKEWANKYVQLGNPLFIPEASSRQSIANAFYSMSELNAIGYSPFSIESVEGKNQDKIENGYGILKELSPIILKYQGTDKIAGILLDSLEETASIKLGDYIFNFKHEYTWPYAQKSEGEKPRFGGMIIALSNDEFIIAGTGLVITFEANNGDKYAGIGIMDEGYFKDGKFIPLRRMNGDQSHQGRHMDIPGNSFSIQKVKLYSYN